MLDVLPRSKPSVANPDADLPKIVTSLIELAPHDFKLAEKFYGTPTSTDSSRSISLPNTLRVLAEKHCDVRVLNKAQADACMSQSRDGRRVAVLRMIRRSKT